MTIDRNLAGLAEMYQLAVTAFLILQHPSVLCKSLEHVTNLHLKQFYAAAQAMATGSVILAASQASPCREIDLTPPRVLLSNVRDRVLLAWLLDTNILYILSEGRKPRPDPRVTAFYDMEPLHELDISILSIAEIRFGIELQDDAARRAELDD